MIVGEQGMGKWEREDQNEALRGGRGEQEMKMQTYRIARVQCRYDHTSTVLLSYDITVVSPLLKRSHHTVRAECCITSAITKWRGMKTGKKEIFHQ